MIIKLMYSLSNKKWLWKISMYRESNGPFTSHGFFQFLFYQKKYIYIYPLWARFVPQSIQRYKTNDSRQVQDRLGPDTQNESDSGDAALTCEVKGPPDWFPIEKTRDVRVAFTGAPSGENPIQRPLHDFSSLFSFFFFWPAYTALTLSDPCNVHEKMDERLSHTKTNYHCSGNMISFNPIRAKTKHIPKKKLSLFKSFNSIRAKTKM